MTEEQKDAIKDSEQENLFRREDADDDVEGQGLRFSKERANMEDTDDDVEGHAWKS